MSHLRINLSSSVTERFSFSAVTGLAYHMPWISDKLEMRATRWTVTLEPGCSKVQNHEGLTSTPVYTDGPGGREVMLHELSSEAKLKGTRLVLAVCAPLCGHHYPLRRSVRTRSQQPHHCVLPQSSISPAFGSTFEAILFSG